MQTFVDSQWGGVRTFAGRVQAGAPPFGDPASATYKNAAIAVLRATSAKGTAAAVDSSPAAWRSARPPSHRAASPPTRLSCTLEVVSQ